MDEKNTKLSRLELKALAVALVHNDNPIVRGLFYVIPNLRVEQRKFTGFGFYTRFEDNAAIKHEGLDELFLSKHPPSAIGFHPDMEGYVDFLVWIKNGQLECLEAASTGPWPEDECQLVISAWPKD